MRTLHVDFTEGMTSDIQDETAGVAKLIKHFDPITKPRTLTPYFSQTDADGSSTTNRIRDFLYYAGSDGTTPKLWGKGGADASSNRTVIYYKSDYTSNTWAATANNSIGNAAQDGVFVEYHDFFYGICSGGTTGKGYVFRYDPTGSASMDNNYFNTLGATAIIGPTTNLNGSIPNGVVHSKDDILYLACGNFIVSLNYNGGSPVATNPALTLPAKYYISAMCEYGNYLAIGCTPYGAGKSVVYLWDRNSSLTTLSESIDFGYGQLKVLDQIEGVLIGVSLRQDALSTLPPRLVFREYAGSIAQIFREIIGSSATQVQLEHGQKFNANRLYFSAGLTIDGVLHNGVWAVARGPSGRWVVWIDRLPNNDTAVYNVAGFYYLGDYATIAYADTAVHQGSSTTGFHMSMTNSSSSYSATSIVETVINPSMPAKIRGAAGHRVYNKQLHTVDVQSLPLPSAGQLVTKYKTDTDVTGSWTTVTTDTTDNAVSRESVVDASGNYFTDGREFQFRIESTGGAIVNALAYKYEELETNL